MRAWLLVVICLHSLNVSVAITVYSNVELQKHTTTDNSYEQAERLFKLTTRLNATDYFTDYRVCLTESPKPLVCMKFVNTYQKQFVSLWNPTPDKTELYPRFEQDCLYKVAFAESSGLDSMQILLRFTIAQSNCKSKSNIVGGASFEAFGLSPHALASCSTMDLFNNQYSITCKIPSPPQTAEQLICTNVTILLMYEHFDGVSEILPDWSHRYPPMRSVLVNNEQFCTNPTSHSARSLNPVTNVELPENVRWFTGSWFSDHRQKPRLSKLCATSEIPYNHSQCYHSTAHTNVLYEHVPGSAMDVYRHSLFVQKTHILAPVNTSRLTFPKITGENPNSAANKYAFDPVLYTGESTTIANRYQPPEITNVSFHTNCLGRGLARDLCTKLEPLKHTDGTNVSGSIPKNSFILSATHIDETVFLRNITTDPDHTYHFIGASHMRYNFDAVTEYYMGSEFLEGVNRKHDRITVHNLKYDFVSNSNHQSDFLHQLCRSLQNSTMYGLGAKYTIIFQTGAWDLSMASIRRAIKDPFAMPRLMQVFQGIFDGSLLCGGLVEILFLAAVPHPICFDDSNWRCNGHRSYRTNVAIEALNHYLVSTMLHNSQIPYNLEPKRNHQMRRLSAHGSAKPTRKHSVRENKQLRRFETGKKALDKPSKTPTLVSKDPVLDKPTLAVSTPSIVEASSQPNLPSLPIQHAKTDRVPSSIRLSIIDTYAIIHPRLLFNELGETACLNHFTCRVHINPLGKSVLVQSPGGTAVVKSILTALS